MTSGSVALLLVLQAFICGGLAENLGAKKGYSRGAWFAAGFFFGILGLIAAAGLPPSRLRQEQELRELHKASVEKTLRENA